jgi:hypothetical protein
MKQATRLIWIGTFAIFSHTTVSAQNESYEIGDLLYSDSFDGDLSDWSAEIEDTSVSAIQIIDNQLDFTTFGGGTTVWFLPKLEGSLMIEYNATALPIGGVADSVSDINSFWMLTDLNNPDDIQADSAARGGSFSTYHKLPGYYVGLGAGRNTRTTFKKHDMSGNGVRLDWGLLEDEYYLIKPSFPHKIQLVHCEGIGGSLIEYICDDSIYFEKWDSDPSTSGWFAFRGFNTHVLYDNFKVYRLIPDPELTGKSDQLLSRPIDFISNYPNPFSSSTNIAFEVDMLSEISLSVYNVSGCLVTRLFDKKFEKGSYTYPWDTSHLPSGIYIIKLKDSMRTITHKCQLIKL